jgi:hypothetical protein
MFTKKDFNRKQELGIILNTIHSKVQSTDADVSVVPNFKIRNGFLNGQSVKRLIVHLRTTGCQWMLNDTNGGCTICGHFEKNPTISKIHGYDYTKHFDNIISNFEFSDIPIVCVYNTGSFFNTDEITANLRIHIYQKLNVIDEIRSVVFESRPEYITESVLRELKAKMPNKEIEIGIGLESCNDYIRNMCINKGVSTDDVFNAVYLLKQHGINPIVYVLLKPPFVSEKHAIEDAINTIEYVFYQGVETVSLEPLSVQKHTITDLMYSVGSYRPPWIWSVLEVVSSAWKKKYCIRIGGFEFVPSPYAYSRNCSICSNTAIEAIKSFNSTNDINLIRSALTLDCNCKAEWLSQLKEPCSIKNSIDAFLSNTNVVYC